MSLSLTVDHSASRYCPRIVGYAMARDLASQVAAVVTDAARLSPVPAVFVTGNRYFPPVRSFWQAGYVYNADNAAAFGEFLETLESQL